jgi:hypothetical protein
MSYRTLAELSDLAEYYHGMPEGDLLLVAISIIQAELPCPEGLERGLHMLIRGYQERIDVLEEAVATLDELTRRAPTHGPETKEVVNERKTNRIFSGLLRDPRMD